MPDSEFSEDEFEDQLLYDLWFTHSSDVPHFKPTRSLENHVGFDFAIRSDYSHLHSSGLYLNDGRVRSMLPVQAKAVLPRRYVSAFVQCKVPYFVSRRHAATLHVWNHWKRPHYRIDVDGPQCNTLLALDAKVAADAVVRYAMPAFHTFSEADALLSAGAFTQSTHFQSPGALKGHAVYSYVTATGPGKGFSVPQSHDSSPLIPKIRRRLRDLNRGAFINHVIALGNYFSLTESVPFEVQDRDIVTATHALGWHASLPVDPLGVLGEDPFLRAEYPLPTEYQIEGPSLRIYGAVLFALNRACRDLDLQWRTFYWR